MFKYVFIQKGAELQYALLQGGILQYATVYVNTEGDVTVCYS